MSFFRGYPAGVFLLAARERLASRIGQTAGTLHLKFWLRALGCRYGAGLVCDGFVWLSCRKKGAISLGNNVHINSRRRSNLVGMTNPTIFQCIGDGRIEIGDNSGVSGAVLSSRTRIVIGKHVKLGGNVRIFDHDYHALDAAIRRSSQDTSSVRTAPVIVEDDVFIGTNAVILKGVTVGAGAIIGCGAVVTRAVPGGEVWAGNPARPVEKKD